MAEKQRDEATVEVSTKTGERDKSKEPVMPPGPNPELADDKKKEGAELSPEDAALKERLDTSLARAMEADAPPALILSALTLLGGEIKSATSSMTSVPKPFKMLHGRYKEMVGWYEGRSKESPHAANWTVDVQRAWADILSVLSMTMGKPGSRSALAYKLAGHPTSIAEWGSEYVRHISGEIGQEYAHRTLHAQTGGAAAAGGAGDSASAATAVPPVPTGTDDLIALVKTILPYCMAHNAEVEAVDLCMDTDQLPLLTQRGLVDSTTLPRTVAYLLRCAEYSGDADEASQAVDTAFELCLAHGQWVDALRVALKRGMGGVGADAERRIKRVFDACKASSSSSSSTGSGSGGEDAVMAGSASVGGGAAGGGGKHGASGSAASASAPPSVPRSAVLAQMGYILGRHKSLGFVAHNDTVDALIGNGSLSSLFASLARDLDCADPKGPEDIYKTHLTTGAGSGRGGRGGAAGGDAAAGGMESARGNLASSYVSAFVNCAHGSDKLITPPDSGWVHRNRDHGQMAAVASLGMVHLWDSMHIDAADKYLNAGDSEWQVAGGVLAMALMSAGTRNLDVDPMLALLGSYIEPGSTAKPMVRMAALFGLGVAYAGTGRGDVVEAIQGYLDGSAEGSGASWELACIAGLAVGLIHVGSADELAASAIADELMTASATEAGQAITRHLCLGLALLFLGRGPDSCEAILEILSAVEHPVGEQAKILVTACAHAGSGNVLAVQGLLKVCASHPEHEERVKREEEAKKKAEEDANARAASATGGAGGAAAGNGASTAAAAGGKPGGAGATGAAAADANDAAGKYVHQSLAVIGLALVSMGEDLSINMATRMADHLLQYGDTAVRRAVPLALALLHLGDPDYGIVDVLSKLTHDANEETSQAAIIALGLVGAGTNNSRIAGLLRTLSVFYKTEPNHLFVVRLAQGLLHAGKGLVTINPVHSDRQLLSPVSLAGVLSSMLLFIDVKTSLHAQGAKWHFLLFSLALSIYPRFTITVDEAGAPTVVEVRVGTAVETVGQAGRPKTITGFQTHSTPVLMGVKDRAELVDQEAHIPATPVVEGIVVLVPNPAAPSGGAAGAKGKSGGAAASKS